MFIADLKDTESKLYFTMHYTDKEEKDYKVKGNTQRLCFEHEKLEPCPYCSGEGQIKSGISFTGVGLFIECKNCGRGTTRRTEGQRLAFNGQRARYIGICEVLKEVCKEWNSGEVLFNKTTSIAEKTFFCKAVEDARRYEVENVYGDCLEDAGLIMPKGGFARIDKNAASVKVGDLVHCSAIPGQLNTYIKQVKAIGKDVVIVGTAYKNAEKDYAFIAGEIMGTVTDVYDLESGERIYKRGQELKQ